MRFAMPRLAAPFLFATTLTMLLAAQAPSTPFVPPRGVWELEPPAQFGLDPALLGAAVELARQGEIDAPRDTRAFLARSFGDEPHHEPIGPVFDRGDTAGAVVVRGHLVAAWGDVHRADMCNSVTKTFLTAVVGVAWQRGLVRGVHDRAAGYMPAGVDLFASEHNRPITWDHLLRQTSDWQGELWGKPDWADRPVGKTPADWPRVPRHEPGARYEYNDVRVNVLALAALHVWRRPLPVVLREELMDPIGASSTWRWHGYDTSWLELDGTRVQSVSGGGHWGGGLVIDTLDLARFGLLCARDGRWGDRQLVDARWFAMARTPGSDNPAYGHANWFLNPDRKAMPAAPATAVRFLGNGGNVVCVDREHDLVIVTRWLRESVFQQVLAKVLAAMAAAPR
jgi:CubicO group peptidase (beta-lactamase class C family)